MTADFDAMTASLVEEGTDGIDQVIALAVRMRHGLVVGGWESNAAEHLTTMFMDAAFVANTQPAQGFVLVHAVDDDEEDDE